MRSIHMFLLCWDNKEDKERQLVKVSGVQERSGACDYYIGRDKDDPVVRRPDHGRLAVLTGVISRKVEK